MATSMSHLDDIAEAHELLVSIPMSELDEHTAAWVLSALNDLDQVVLDENPGTNPAVLREYTDPSRGPLRPRSQPEL